MSLYEMRNTVAGRVAGTLAALALVFSLSFAGADRAQAQTAEELQAQIAQLTALIAELQAQIAGGTTTPSGDFSYVFTRNLTIGSTGQDVLMLQTYLNRNAATQVAAVGVAGGPGTETSYYGNATAAAVKKYQELNRAGILTPLGLVTGTPNFGSSTRAFMNMEIANLDDEDGDEDEDDNGSDSGELRGEEADLTWTIIGESDISQNSSGQHAFTIEIDSDRDGGDAEINRLDLEFSSDASRLYRAISRVTLEVDGDELASQRTDRRGDWRNDDSIRFSGLDLVVRSGETVEIEVLLDVTDEPTEVTLEEVSYRYVDAVGLVMTDEQSNGATVAVGEIEGLDFRFTKNRNTPSNSSLDVSSNRNNETLVITDVEVRRGVEGVVEDVRVEVTFDDAVNVADVQALVSRFMLELDGRQVDSINASAIGVANSGATYATASGNGVVTLVFDADEFVVEGGDDFEVEVLANFRAYETAGTCNDTTHTTEAACVGDGDTWTATRDISAVQVTGLAFAGFDEAADEEFDFADANSSVSWAADFTLSQGDVEVVFTETPKATLPSDTNTGTIVFTVALENNTGETLTGLLTGSTWELEVGKYVTANVATSVAAVDGSTATLTDGNEAEYRITVNYTDVYANDDFAVEITEVAGIPVSFTWEE